MTTTSRLSGVHEALVLMNRRILVIDDNEAIHQYFRKVLGDSSSE